MTNGIQKMEEIEKLIKANIPDAVIESGDFAGDPDSLHMELMVASDRFKDKRLLEQHRMVMDILKESLKESVHAVKIKTMTLEQYREIN